MTIIEVCGCLLLGFAYGDILHAGASESYIMNYLVRGIKLFCNFCKKSKQDFMHSRSKYYIPGTKD